LAGGVPLREGALFVMVVIQKTAEGQPGIDVLGMPLNKILVLLFDAIQTLLDFQIERRTGFAAARLGESVGVVHPAQDFLLGGIVIEQNSVELVFVRVIRTDDSGDREGKAGFFGDQIAHRLRRIGGQQGAQETS
jgi:hypothetical protein